MSARGGAGQWLRDHVVVLVSVLVLVYLFLPIAYTFVFSFNDYTKSNIVWSGNATIEHWLHPCGAPGIPTLLIPVRNGIWPVMKAERPAVELCSA